MALFSPRVLTFREWAVSRLLDAARFVLLMIGLGYQRRIALCGFPEVALRAASAAVSKAVVFAVRIRVYMVIADAKV